MTLEEILQGVELVAREHLARPEKLELGMDLIEDLELDMSELRPLPRRFYHYQGSLTTPPCSEGVQWVVMAERRQISKEQMATMVSHLHDNNRPVKPLNDREIVLVSDRGF